MPLELMLSAGEASGDNYGAMLLTELRRHTDVHAFGLGGDEMRAAGCNLTVHAREVAAVGITEIVRLIPKIYARYRELVAEMKRRRPAALVLIDFPDVNFKLAKQAHRLGIPVIFFVSPQLWAWKQWRLKHVQRYVTKMLVIFPFEEKFYRDRKVDAVFVGHPLADLELPSLTREQFAADHKLDPSKFWIALLPGSRRGEVRLNLPTMLNAAALLENQADLQFVLPVASTLTEPLVRGFLTADAPPLTLVPHEHARAALLHARASVVASGTATVEAALIGNPFVVVYRVSPLTYAIGKRLVSLEHYAMPNLIAGREAVPELIQHRFTAQTVVSRLTPLIQDSPERLAMIDNLREVRRLLQRPPGSRSAMARTAAAVLEAVAASS